MINIAVKGRKYAGKDTVGSVLINGFLYKRVSFATPLKRMISVLLEECGYDEDEIARMVDGDKKEIPVPELGGKTTRYLMQTLGTEWRDMIHKTLWVDIAKRKISNLNDSGEDVVVTDLRFPHEAEALRHPAQDDLFDPFFIVEVVRPGSSTGNGEKHASETLQDSIEADAIIMNTGTVADLSSSVGDVVDYFIDQDGNNN